MFNLLTVINCLIIPTKQLMHVLDSGVEARGVEGR